MTALSDADWRISYLPLSGDIPKSETVRAAYPGGDTALPGWTVLKNYDHKIVKLVRTDHVQSIERIPPDIGNDDASERALRYAPDVTGQSDGHGSVLIGDESVSQTEARARGFARASNVSFTSDWVQADGFMVRGLFRRGDAQRFSDAELRDLVAKFLADHGVDFNPPDHPDTLEAFCFNYEAGASMDQVRATAAADKAAAEP